MTTLVSKLEPYLRRSSAMMRFSRKVLPVPSMKVRGRGHIRGTQGCWFYLAKEQAGCGPSMHFKLKNWGEENWPSKLEGPTAGMG